MTASNNKTYCLALVALLFLFYLRVVGQLAVSLGGADFLPPMEQWYSGLLPYNFLLFCQMTIIALFGKICIDIGSHSGYFSVPRARLGSFLIKFSYVYYATMVLRYIIHMSLHPDDRWIGGTIPIVFHFVLATYLLLLGRYNKRQQPKES